MGQNAVQAVKDTVKRGQNGIKRGQNGLKGVKIASKKGPKAPKILQMGSKWAQKPSTGSKSVKMAFNWRKMAFNRPKSSSTGSKWLQ